jgi:hypothetical protein
MLMRHEGLGSLPCCAPEKMEDYKVILATCASYRKGEHPWIRCSALYNIFQV